LVRSPGQTQIGCTVTPGASIGTIIIEMPLCFGASGSVRTATQLCVATCAIVFHIFWPFTTHWSPSSTARVRNAAMSVPASDSEYATAKSTSALVMRGSQWRFCSSLPIRMIVGAADVTVSGSMGAPAPSSSSTKIH
jgi:hypothetical protein